MRNGHCIREHEIFVVFDNRLSDLKKPPRLTRAKITKVVLYVRKRPSETFKSVGQMIVAFILSTDNVILAANKTRSSDEGPKRTS